MKKTLKGVSPVVAVVIMIAVVVVLSTMVFTWVMDDTSKHTSTLPDCVVNTEYTVDSAKFKSSRNETRVMVRNKGADSIYGFSLQLENSTDLQTVTGLNESPQTNSSSGLSKGNSVFLSYASEGNWNRSMGLTLTNVKVVNSACPEVSAEISTIKQIT